MSARVINAWVAAMETQGLAVLTVKRRRSTAERFAAFLAEDGRGRTILTVKGGDITDWLGSLRDPSGALISDAARAAYLKDLRHLYRWLVLHERIGKDPTAIVPLPKVRQGKPRPVARADLIAALDAARSARDNRMVVMLLLGAFAGLRAHEIAGLDASDVDHEAGRLTVRGKGGRERLIPLHDLIREALAAEARSGPVVRSKITGEALTPKTVVQLVSAHFHAIGRNVTGHQLRHFFGTMTYAECLDLRAVQELLGHANPGTTQVYVAFSEQTQRSAVAGLSLAG